MDLEQVLTPEGQLPPRPPSLINSLKCNGQAAECMADLLMSNHAVVLGGLSIVGREGHLVPLVTAAKISQDNNLKGWSFSIVRGETILRHIDTNKNLLDYNPIPNCMTYFVSELSDECLLEADAPEEPVREIIRFVLPFISDEGPPHGIDW